MNAMSATKARANLFKIMEFVNDNSQPLTLTNSKGKNAVLKPEYVSAYKDSEYRKRDRYGTYRNTYGKRCKNACHRCTKGDKSHCLSL